MEPVPAPRPRGLIRRVPVFARSADQVDRYAAAWERANTEALHSDGALWIVLGDSAAQGVGASAYDRGYVGKLRTRLEEYSGRPWRVINLSRSGARTHELVIRQLPRMAALPTPDLVTAVVGGNDAVHTPLAQWLADIDSLCAGLPRGAVVATVSRGVRERRTRVANTRLRAAAAVHGLRVADIWSYTGPPYRGKYADGFHPNERGYDEWVAALADAVGLQPVTGPRPQA